MKNEITRFVNLFAENKISQKVLIELLGIEMETQIIKAETEKIKKENKRIKQWIKQKI